MMTSDDVCRVHREYLWRPRTPIGSKARWAPQARRKACMGWSWAAACIVYRGRGISWLQLVNWRLQPTTAK